MAAKPIILSHRTFIKKGDAEKHYLDKSKEVAANKTIVSNGELFIELKEIFERYCSYTKYAKPGAVIAFTARNKTTEVNGRFITNICYYVHFDNDTEDDFSIKKALTEIANHSS